MQFLRTHRKNRAARERLRNRLPALDFISYGIDKLADCVALIYDEDTTLTDDVIHFTYEYESVVFDIRLQFHANGFLKIFVDAGVLPLDLFHVAAFVAEIPLLATWAPFLKSSVILQEFAGYADLLWKSNCKIPLPLHPGFECFHQRFCYDMLSKEGPAPGAESAIRVTLPDDMKGMLIAEFSPPDSEKGETNWRGYPIPALGAEYKGKPPTRINARMLAQSAYPVKLEAKDGTIEGFMIKAGVEADFQLPRWMVPNAFIRSTARLIVRLFYSRLKNMSKNWDAGPYPERMRERQELYDTVQARIKEHTVTIKDEQKTVLELGRELTERNREKSQAMLGKKVKEHAAAAAQRFAGGRKGSRASAMSSGSGGTSGGAATLDEILVAGLKTVDNSATPIEVSGKPKLQENALQVEAAPHPHASPGGSSTSGEKSRENKTSSMLASTSNSFDSSCDTGTGGGGGGASRTGSRGSNSASGSEMSILAPPVIGIVTPKQCDAACSIGPTDVAQEFTPSEKHLAFLLGYIDAEAEC
eukprot:g195.t1